MNGREHDRSGTEMSALKFARNNVEDRHAEIILGKAIERLDQIDRMLQAPMFGNAVEIEEKGERGQQFTLDHLRDQINQLVLDVLAASIFPAAIETELLGLRQRLIEIKRLSPHESIGRQNLEDLRLLVQVLCKVMERARLARVPAAPDPSKPGDRLDASTVPTSGERSCSVSRRPDLKADERESLDTIPIRFAKGVGPRRARLLNKLGIRTIEDALWFLPWRYEDRTVITAIRDLQIGCKATVCGVVRGVRLQRSTRRHFTILTVSIDDRSGILECVFFNQPFLETTFVVGTRVLITGLPAMQRGPRGFSMKSPQYEILNEADADDESGLSEETGRIVPIYHETKGLTSRHIRWLLGNILRQYELAMRECLPDSVLQRVQLPRFPEAVRRLHCPSADDDIAQLNQGTTPAHGRLAFEELFLLQLALGFRRRLLKKDPGIPFQIPNPLLDDLRALLPFQPTIAQERVIREIAHDMTQPVCMNRLLQGDVGSGKTLVALHALVMACGSGCQAVLMVPTEVLAEQHFLNLLPYCDALHIELVLVRGGQSHKERHDVLDRLQTGQARIAIGTHALLQPEVRFARLGLVIVDEQHKFGVLQRARLLQKGQERPHVLVMTATPIPRTLAMTAYGDLDVSVIDQLPPGRKPVHTLVFSKAERSQAYRLLHREVQAGRQAYIVYPLVERSEKVDLQAAIEAARELQQHEFAAYTVGLLHGKMKTRDKQSVMAQFQAGRIQILVATTVIEVGVDVPNATVMLVENADRFGLAQLHQLRGRVGRASWDSYCLLISSQTKRSDAFREARHEQSSWLSSECESLSSPTVDRDAKNIGWKRLEILSRCTDGFQLAEEDLRLRGPGDILGVRQWGPLEFRVAHLIRDRHLLEKARTMAEELLRKDPDLTDSAHAWLKQAVLARWGNQFELGTIG
ncbi:MAG: ATP-dependent DNA helicase RecG [Nitrospirae bacterium]|nr:MAG: ATP-dependent DNA helicase RecG [Nitrospirota bacterium]